MMKNMDTPPPPNVASAIGKSSPMEAFASQPEKDASANPFDLIGKYL